MVNEFTAEYLSECFTEAEGRIFWRKRPLSHFSRESGFKKFNACFPGREAGGERTDKRDGRKTWATELNDIFIPRYVIVWALHKGEVTTGLDHKNRNSLDDKIDNLRIATPKENSRNTCVRKDNISGLKGVSLASAARGNKWRARITVDGKIINLGYFKDPKDAHDAYVAAAIVHFKEFACIE